jgi:hypothetical protein
MSASSSPKQKQGENSAFSGTLVSPPLVPARRVQLPCTSTVILEAYPSLMACNGADVSTVNDEPPVEHSFVLTHHARRRGSQAKGEFTDSRDWMLSGVVAVEDLLAA